MGMKRKGRVFVAALLVALAALAVFAGCTVDDEVTQGDGDVYVSLWEGNGYTATTEEAVALMASMPSREGFAFGGWFYDHGTWLRPVTAENIVSAPQGTYIYAKWIQSDDLVTVTFYDNTENAVLYRAYVEKGTDLSGLGITPSYKAEDERYRYTFKGWDKDLSSIAEDTDVYPVYDTTLRTYNVTFAVNGVAVKTESVPYGGSAQAPSESDIRKYLPYIEGKKVEFSHWSKSADELSYITGDVTVTALYNTSDLRFTVTFNYGNGLTYVQTVGYGENALPPTSNLDKPSDPDTDYVFAGWDGNYFYVTEDRVINAVYDNRVRYYTVDFYDGDVLYCRRYVPLGGSAALPEKDPVRASDANFDYSFAGWQGKTDDISADTKVYADYEGTARRYKVSFYVEGTLIAEKYATYGSSAEAPSDEEAKAAVKEEDGVIKTFAGWDKSFNSITADTVVNAEIDREAKVFDVTFVWGLAGENSSVDRATYGTAAEAPEIADVTTEDEGTIYVFDGWDGDWSSVKEDMTVTAIYKKYPKTFKVEFFDAYGARIGDVQMVEYGGSAAEPQAPVKTADAQYEYVFSGWDTDAWRNVKEDVEVRPVYGSNVRSYTVRFLGDDGTELSRETVRYGSSASAPEDPVKAATAQYEYTFTGWSGDEWQNVTGDVTVYAVYTRAVRSYTVTFVYGNVDDPESEDYKTDVQSVEYGGSAVQPSAEEAVRPDDVYATYQFVGWSDANYLNVTEDITVTAQYIAYDKYFEVSFMSEDGSLLRAPQYVRYGRDSANLPDTANIVKQQTVSHTFAFDGWTYDRGDGTQVFVSHDEFASLAQNRMIDRDYVLTAHFAETLRKYTVIFYDDDRTTVLSEQVVDYGASAAEPETPVKDMTVQWVYTFGGWSSDAWTEIGGDTVVYATYKQELREYDVTFVYGNVDDPSSADYRTLTVPVPYGTVPSVPDEIDTARPSTAKYDYTFGGWDGLLAVSGDMTVTANYVASIRNYTVTFYNLTTGALEGENVMPYGSWIERTMSAGGYVFDSWYLADGDGYTALPTREEVEQSGGEGHVNGDMTLYGNLVMEGITFDSSNNINGYTGSNSFVVIPTYANRQKVGAVNSYMFLGRTQEEIEAVYVPLGVQLSGRAFRSIENSNWLVTIPDGDVASTIVVYCEAEDDGGWDAAWDQFDTNWDSGIDGDRKYFAVKGIETVGDYNYVLLADNTAIIQRFVNGTKKYVELPIGSVTVSGGDNAGTYTITELAGSAFRGMSNVETVFISNGWKDLKIGRTVFSGLTATIYIAVSDSGKVGNVPAIAWGGIEGAQVVTKWASWNAMWASQASGDSGELTLEWNCDGLYTGSDSVTYLLRSNSEAIAISQDYTFFGNLTHLTIPESVTVNDKVYTVTEIGDQLFKDEILLTQVTIPGTIKRIGEQAFYGTNLSTLTLSDGLEEIGNLAFAMNTSLTYVYIPASCSTIGYFAFAGANNAELFMGRSSAPTGSGLIGYKLGWNTTIDLTGLDISSIGSMVSSLVGSGTTLPTYWNAVGKTEIELRDWNGIIAARAVLEFVVQNDGNARLIKVSQSSVFDKLDSFTIPSSVTYNDVTYTVTAIDDSAFSGWSIDTLGIPSTVTSIGSNAFSSVGTINTDLAQPADGTLPEGWAFDATNITINYGQTL